MIRTGHGKAGFLPLLAIAAFCLLGTRAWSVDESWTAAVFELPSEDITTITPEEVIKEYSPIVAGKGTGSKASLADAYRFRGVAYSQLEMWDAARKDFEELCKLCPNDMPAKWRLASALAALGLYDEALREIERVLATSPAFARAYVTRAGISLERGAYGACMEDCARAILLDEKCAMAYYTRALLYYQKADPMRCMEDISRYMHLEPIAAGRRNPEKAYILKGLVLSWLRRPQDAVPIFLMARRLNPSSPKAVWGLWQAYFDLGKTNLALRLSELLLKLEPKEPQSIISHALSCAAVGRSNEAAEACAQALRMDGRSSYIIYESGNVYSINGDYAAALRQYEKIVEADPYYLRALAARIALLSSCPVAKFRDGSMARTLTEKLFACDLEPWMQPEYLMASAMAHAERGEFGEAAATARKALDWAGPGHFRRGEMGKML